MFAIKKPSIRRLFFSIYILAYFFGLIGAENGLLYSLYTLTVFFLIKIVFVRGFSFFFAFLTLFFVLGNWLKLTSHRIFDYDYIEPIGSFSGAQNEWDLYFQNSIVVAVAMIAAKSFINLFIFNGQIEFSRDRGRKIQKKYWLALSFLLLSFYTLNFFVGFFRTGVGSSVSLPLGLGAGIAFMVYLGMPLVVATYVSIDLAGRKELSQPAFLTLILLGVALSISTASRASMFIQIAPVLVGIVLHSMRFQFASSMKNKLLFFGVATVIALVSVSLYRIVIFYESSIFDQELLEKYANETANLFVDRWIGVESMMIAASTPQASINLFIQLLLENPSIGVDSIYQSLAGSFYSFMSGKTFLTLPGMFAILALSGNVAVIFFGVIFIVVCGFFLERFVALMAYRRLPVVVLVSAALANAVSQTAFPRLLLPLIIQLILMLVILRVVFPKTRET